MKANKNESVKVAIRVRPLNKREKELNEIKSGKFQVIKNPKSIRKWNKKMKKQLVSLPAEVF